MATGTNAQLLQLSGKRNPYPGEPGVIEEGALADLLLVDGNPVENIKLIEYDFARYGQSAERRRLIERWDREVNSLPR